MFINNLKNKFPDMQNIFIMMLKVISERFFHPQFINNTFIKNIFSMFIKKINFPDMPKNIDELPGSSKNLINQIIYVFQDQPYFFIKFEE